MADPSLRGLGSTGGLTFFILSLVFMVLAIIAVGMRLWAKRILGRQFQLHDYSIFFGLFFAFGYAINTLLSVNPGVIGLHVADVMETLPPDALTITLKVFFASGFLWITATTFIKLSILLLYIGIFQTRPFLWAAWGVVSLSVMFWVACILTGFLMCRPLAFNWDKSIEDAHCGNTYSQEVGSAAINMILDFMIVILPLPVLWSLQVPVKKKIMLSGVLSLGLCICGMNITRVVMIATSDTVDYTYSLTNAGIFKGLEVYLGIVTSCLPTFGPLLVREKVMSRSHTFKNSNFTGPSKASTHNRSLFETVGGDDIPLRKVTAQGGRDPYAVSMHGEGISVKTEVQVFGSPAGRARKGLML